MKIVIHCAEDVLPQDALAIVTRAMMGEGQDGMLARSVVIDGYDILRSGPQGKRETFYVMKEPK